MATAESNLQLANLLFAPLREGAGRYMDAQVQIAQRAEQERKQRELINLKRMQEIEDQQAESKMREKLTNLQVEAQKDIEESRAKRDDTRMTAAQKAADARVAAEEEKAIKANVRVAYEKYKADGGPRKLAEFGPEYSPNTIYAIQNAHQEVVAESTKRRFAQFGENLMARERALAQSVEPNDKELASIRQEAISFVSGDATQAPAAEYYAKLAAKNPDAAYAATVQRFPAFGAAVEAQVQRGSSAMRAEKAKSPEFIKNLQSLSVDRQAITEAAVKNPYGDAFFEAIKPLPITTPKKPADLSGAGGVKGLISAGNIDLKKQPKVKNPNGGTSTVFSKSFNIDGKEYLLTSITPEGKFLKTDQEVLDYFKKTGKHLGIYDSVESANAGGKKLHDDFEAGLYEPDPVGPLANLGKTYGDKGVIGVADSARGEVSPVDLLKMTMSPVQSVASKAISTPASWVARNAPYMAGVPLQILGGDELVRSSGIDQYDTLLNNLRAQNNFQQVIGAVRPSYQRAADTLRNLLPANP